MWTADCAAGAGAGAAPRSRAPEERDAKTPATQSSTINRIEKRAGMFMTLKVRGMIFLRYGNDRLRGSGAL